MFGFSTLGGISILWWMLGTFGTVGTVLMLWFAPALLARIVTAVFGFFLTNRIGQMIAIGAIAFFVGDVNRSILDTREFAAKTALFEHAQKERDARIAQQTRDEVWTEIANQTAANAVTDQEAKDFTDAIPTPPANTVNPFRVGDNACKLRKLAGQAGCGPKGAARSLPKAGVQGKPAADHKRHRLPESIRRILGRDQEKAAGPGRP